MEDTSVIQLPLAIAIRISALEQAAYNVALARSHVEKTIELLAVAGFEGGCQTPTIVLMEELLDKARRAEFVLSYKSRAA